MCDQIGHEPKSQSYYESYLAACPFYKRESSYGIECDGISEGSRITLAFLSTIDAREHKNACCRHLRGYQACPIYRLLEGLSNEHGDG